MPTTYKTKAGDMVDYIVWKHYGRLDGLVVERVLEANPGLADLGPVLGPGVKIVLPEIDSPGKTDGVRLWS